jgi:Domain of unknown function (DUF4395)
MPHGRAEERAVSSRRASERDRDRPSMSEADGALEDSMIAAARASQWIARNLIMQGYRLSDVERGRLKIGLRFATGMCLPLVALALVFESSALLVALAAVGAVAGLTPRHPFDLVWNSCVRYAFGAPPLPPNPIRRRHAFKIAAVWLLGVAALFAAALPTAALALGGVLLAACGIVTAVNFCLPSFLLSVLDRAVAPYHRARPPACRPVQKEEHQRVVARR